MKSALRESAGPETEDGGVGDRATAGSRTVPVLAPPLRLAGDPDDDDSESHICRGID